MVYPSSARTHLQAFSPISRSDLTNITKTKTKTKTSKDSFCLSINLTKYVQAWRRVANTKIRSPDAPDGGIFNSTVRYVQFCPQLAHSLSVYWIPGLKYPNLLPSHSTKYSTCEMQIKITVHSTF